MESPKGLFLFNKYFSSGLKFWIPCLNDCDYQDRIC